jgi:hypothetical protein
LYFNLHTHIHTLPKEDRHGGEDMEPGVVFKGGRKEERAGKGPVGDM